MSYECHSLQTRAAWLSQNSLELSLLCLACYNPLMQLNIHYYIMWQAERQDVTNVVVTVQSSQAEVQKENSEREKNKKATRRLLKRGLLTTQKQLRYFKLHYQGQAHLNGKNQAAGTQGMRRGGGSSQKADGRASSLSVQNYAMTQMLGNKPEEATMTLQSSPCLLTGHH